MVVALGPVSLLAVVLAGAAACNPSVEAAPGKPGASGGAGGGVGGRGGGGGARPGPDANFGFVAPDVGGERPGVGAPGEPMCAYQAHMAERLPLDLLLLVDASGSMLEMIGTRKKWDMVGDALVAFIKDPKSAGLGLGLQFFPLAGGGTICTTPAQCGYVGPNPAQVCEQRRACIGPGTAVRAALGCSARFDFAPCPTGTTCVALGTCSVSGVECGNVGAMCPGGLAGDRCLMEPLTCYSGLPICAAEEYQRLAVPIGALPGGALAAVRTLAMRRAGGVTPMGPAVLGALERLRMHLSANPNRRAALVIATDGLPGGCATGDVQTIGDAIYSARTTPPSITTFAIGVFAPAEQARGRAALEELAGPGGSGAPIILTATEGLGDRLQEALAAVRGAALPCEYVIPPERRDMLDFAKVNVHFKGAGGEEDIPYVGRAADCHPTRGGWYYDVDPKTAVPSRVIACDLTCRRFKGDGSARVELRFGCKTVVIE